MKKHMLIFVLMLILSLTACTNQRIPSTSAGNENPSQSNGVISLDAGGWPDNEYTAGLPVPPGTVVWATLDIEHQNCTVNLTGINENDYNEYLEALKQAGFSVIQRVSEEIKGEDYVASGILLTNEEKGISISYIPDGLIILISFNLQ